MKIGLIGAMDIELAHLIDDMQQHTVEQVLGAQFHLGRIGGVDVVLAKCGIGKVAAAVTAQTMLLRYAPDLLINTGVGGSLTTRLSVGAIAISARAVEHDMDTSPLGDPVGLISGINRIYLDADQDHAQRLLAHARDLGLDATLGTVCSGDRFVASIAEKERIASLFEDAAVCEMEGAAIAHTAYLAGVPFVIVRAISDSADGSSSMDYMEFLPLAAERSYSLVRAYLEGVGRSLS